MPAAAPAPARDLAAAAPAALAAAGGDLEAEQLRILRGMSTTFLRCRSDRHSWRTTRGWGVNLIDPDGTERLQVNWAWRAQECRDCGASIERHFSPTLQLLAGGRTDYPDGYLTVGLGRIPPHLARRVLWEREAGPQPEAALAD